MTLRRGGMTPNDPAGGIGLATVAGLALVPLRGGNPDGIVLPSSAGFLWGGSDVAIKAISE